jgi:CheY-like chemotaxis protein
MTIRSVLLVDDDLDDQDIFRTALSEVDGSVELATANNGEDALQKLHGNSHYPDLIFLDINMPVLNGFDTLAQIKKDDSIKRIPVFIYTTSARVEDVERAKELGAIDCVKKPSDFSELCRFIGSVLNTPPRAAPGRMA